ncbi:related to protein arginine N-methyltransferase 3 [Cephalotrichum gorgonifer]|uniref:type I protein arginine methyltransferase n=1 Tax=Cephalotrichum gorgonifer TaxID=2041049 RepID=A0AAE8MTX5_9PEZI|nr:related to protein arginine N-methyltransferase 3 [Cephalotrichum gorgonifer]
MAAIANAPRALSASISGSSSSGESAGGGEWQDLESDVEPLNIVSLFDDKTFPDAKSMLEYCREKYGFDFLATCRRLELDFHGAVKLCNFVRQSIRSGQKLPDVISAEDVQDEALLRPVLEDDGLIIELDDVLAENSVAEPASGLDKDQDSAARNRQLEAQLATLQEQFASYRLTVEETLNRRWGYDPNSKSNPEGEVPKLPSAGFDRGYWESYAGRDIHETMLKDAVRTDAYRDFVYSNKDAFKGKVVLDIGCGTGILSMFCAKAGAKMVLAVDNSSILEKARQNVADNGLSDTITCIAGRIEDVKLPVDKVDVIISEWMGYCLLYEAMLNSVLWARDKYLKPDGILAPSVATIWASPVSDEEYVTENISFWQDVYGFSMKTMQEGIYDEAHLECMPEQAVCGQPFPLIRLDLHNVTVEELDFTAPWSTKLTRDIDNLDGFLIWFDIFFTSTRDETLPAASLTSKDWISQDNSRVAFTTGPFGRDTHWKQGLLLAPTEKEGPSALKAGTELSGETTFSALKTDSRALSIKTTWGTPGQEKRSMTWNLS